MLTSGIHCFIYVMEQNIKDSDDSIVFPVIIAPRQILLIAVVRAVEWGATNAYVLSAFTK